MPYTVLRLWLLDHGHDLYFYCDLCLHARCPFSFYEILHDHRTNINRLWKASSIGKEERLSLFSILLRLPAQGQKRYGGAQPRLEMIMGA